MSLDIVSRTIGGELDKKFVLRNHQCARTLSIQDNWTRLRIGCRFALVDTGSDLAGTPRLYFGLLASPSPGLTNGPLGPSTSHFVGVQSNDPTLTRLVGPPVNYQIGAGLMRAITKVGTTVAAVNFAPSIFLPAAPASLRWGIIVEFLKGSPNWTVDLLGCASAGSTDADYDLFVQAMEAQTMAGAEGVLDTTGAYTNDQITTLAVDEATNGLLNAVCMAWDRSSVQLEWSEVLFAKFA